jgi:hypothetical protein
MIDREDHATLWIPIEGDPLPLQEETELGGVLEFREWGEPVTVKTPPAEQVIDLGRGGATTQHDLIVRVLVACSSGENDTSRNSRTCVPVNAVVG